MAVVSMNFLLEAGVHFGHQTNRWNPKMKEYIFAARDDIYIIDLKKTTQKIEEAYVEIKNIATNGGNFLFVGTKKQANEACVEEAIRSDSYYVTERWLGGTLTNFRTIRRRVKRLDEIEKMEADGTFELLPKKEVIGIKKEYDKLNRVLVGIRKMEKLPQGLIIVDPKKEINAIREARKLNIPVFGIVDTNCDPDDVDYVIPANDDAVRSVKVILGVLANAICEAKSLPMVDYVNDDEKKKDHAEVKVVDSEMIVESNIVESNNIKEETVIENKKEDIEPIKEIKKTKEKSIAKKVVKKTEDLSEKTLADLKLIAKEKGLKGYSALKKDDLIKLINS